MTRNFLISAAVLGFLGVALGAFGAHGLQATLDANGRAGTFDTASRYHLLHTVLLVGIALLTAQVKTEQQRRWIHRSGWLIIVGTIIFSGSLYILAIFNLSIMGAVAPIGGLALLAGWACLGIAAWQMN